MPLTTDLIIKENNMKLVKIRKNPFFERLLRLIPDSLYLRFLYKKNVGHWPDLSNPKTFTEKLQWLKIHNRKPEYSIMVDSNYSANMYR